MGQGVSPIRCYDKLPNSYQKQLGEIILTGNCLKTHLPRVPTAPVGVISASGRDTRHQRAQTLLPGLSPVGLLHEAALEHILPAFTDLYKAALEHVLPAFPEKIKAAPYEVFTASAPGMLLETSFSILIPTCALYFQLGSERSGFQKNRVSHCG